MNAVPRTKSKGDSLTSIDTEVDSGQLLSKSLLSEQSFLPSKSKNPTILELHGIHICFPFEPYPCQKDYMGSVIRALHFSENALLESPTGTGKTLCLLCSTLAWQSQNARRMQGETSAVPTRNTIIYASRTHSQLSQVVRELKNTRYRPRHTVVASREQLCINERVVSKKTATAINNECSKLNKERKCRFRNNLDRFGGPSNVDDTGEPTILDVEELKVMGKAHSVCPFFYARDAVKDCDLVLVPYNYLFDKEARTTLEIQWNNAILIFDEAHNLESFASDATSFELTGLDIAGAINEVSKGIELVSTSISSYGVDEGIKVDNLVKLKAMFLRIEEFLDSVVPAQGGSFAGEYIFEAWRYASITYQNHQLLIDFTRKITEVITEAHGGMSSGTPKLDHFIGCLRRTFGGTSEAQCLAKARSYRVYVTPHKKLSNDSSKNNVPRTLSYWCFAPSLAMRELVDLGLRSIIVTSGTLSPIKSYSLTLGIPFHITLENPHIIQPNQVYIRVIGRGVSDQLLKSSFERREDKDYIAELGNTLVALSKVIPGGMLIFFPSYSVMDKSIDEWGGPMGRKWFDGGHKKMNNFFASRQGKKMSSPKTCESFSFPCVTHYVQQQQGGSSLTVWKRLLSQKSIVLEPRSTTEMKDAISEFDKYIESRDSKGCILMGVCRGKISEGIDFADHRARAVIITGIPFPPFQDPKVRLKREYLDASMAEAKVKPSGGGGFGEIVVAPEPPGQQKENISGAEGMSGSEWYSQEALRAVNQAVGRVIRHRFDYGAVLLLDSRFGDHRNKEGMSKWVRPYILSDDGFGPAISKLAKFYREAVCDPLLNIKKATASDSDSKRKPARNSSQGLILNYENSNVPTEDEKERKINITVVQAAIKKDDVKGIPPLVGCDGVGSSHRDGYIPADRVIKRIEVKTSDIEEKLAENNLDCCDKSSLEKSCDRPGLNAVFQQRKLPCSGNLIDKNITNSKTPEESKGSALTFFKAAQSSMTADEFQALRLLVSKLKDSGEKNDTLTYLTVARQMLQLFLPYDDKNDLVALLMPILPTKQQAAVQLIAQELRALVRQSKVKESMSHFEAEKAMQSALFRPTSKAFNTKEKELDEKEAEAQRREKEISLMNAERIVNAAKNRVGDGIQLKLNSDFGSKSIAAQRGKKLSEMLNSSAENGLFLSFPVSKKAKRELDAGHVTFDKYKCITETHESIMKSDDVDIAHCLQQVSVVSFLTEQCAKQTSLRINTNTPKGLICIICEESMNHPMVAACNHYACKTCWKKWLLVAKNSTCPVCRMPAEMSKLSLLVFERQTGTGVPSLTQLCSAELSSNDDDGTS